MVIIDDIRIYVHCKLGNSIRRQSYIKDSIDVSVNAIHFIIPRIVWLNWKCDFIIFEAKKVSDGIRVALFRQCSDDMTMMITVRMVNDRIIDGMYGTIHTIIINLPFGLLIICPSMVRSWGLSHFNRGICSFKPKNSKLGGPSGPVNFRQLSQNGSIFNFLMWYDDEDDDERDEDDKVVVVAALAFIFLPIYQDST